MDRFFSMCSRLVSIGMKKEIVKEYRGNICSYTFMNDNADTRIGFPLPCGLVRGILVGLMGYH